MATDINASYISTAMESLPDTTIVFDRFHVVKMMNEKITEVRRQLFRELTSPLEKKAVKGK